MRKFSLTLISAALAAGVGGVAAQTLKPGLWEFNNKMSSSDEQWNKEMADMQKEMANMPPDQRKMMEGMMGGGPLTTAVKVCMTKEMMERNEVGSAQDNCKYSYAARSGNSMKFSYVCSKPPSSGEGQVNFVSPEAYTTKMTVKSTNNGKPESVTMDTSGKFLSADCGRIKPPMPPKK